MSIDPHIPPIGGPSQRNTQRINDLTRSANQTKFQGRNLIRAAVNMVWTASATAAAQTVAVPGASGTVGIVVSSQEFNTVVGTIPLFTATNNNNGTFTIRGYTANGAVVTSTAWAVYLAWDASK